MPFGLTNAPNTFIQLMNQVLKLLIGLCVVVYFNDILVFSKHKDENFQYLKVVFDLLKTNQLYFNIKKCEFLTFKLLFLGFTISANGIKMNRTKVEAILDRPTPNLSQKLGVSIDLLRSTNVSLKTLKKLLLQ